MRFLVAAFCVLWFAGGLCAEGDKGALADRVLVSDGDGGCPFTMVAGSEAAVSPYMVCQGTEARKHRTTLIINPQPYVLFIGTFSLFTTTESASFFVLPSSGSWSTSNHKQVWAKYGPGRSSGTIRGYIESE